jgi:two-component system response regulator HydG
MDTQELQKLKNKFDIIGNDAALNHALETAVAVAPTDLTVLVSGESGVGKETIPQIIHQFSRRKNGKYLAVNCGAIPEGTINAELFGHEKGAFTGADRMKVGKFEAASGGTLFLDEITEIDLATQVKLLRALESRTIQRVGGNEDIHVDFRLVAATNRDLAAYVREGKFREDLYYRLNVIDIHLPALKDRPGDIALLVSRFIKEFSVANGNKVTGIDAKAIKALEDYPWPGNVRQLRNVVEKMCVLSSGGKLTLDDVPIEITSALPVAASGSAATPVTPQATLADTAKDTILRVLSECGNNKSQAAIKLGISRRTLHRKLNEWRSA